MLILEVHFKNGIAVKKIEALYRTIAEYGGEGIFVKPKTCRWKYDKNDCDYTTWCGETWVFNAGTAQENGVKFCHHCGGKVVFK